MQSTVSMLGIQRAGADGERGPARQLDRETSCGKQERGAMVLIALPVEVTAAMHEPDVHRCLACASNTVLAVQLINFPVYCDGIRPAGKSHDRGWPR